MLGVTSVLYVSECLFLISYLVCIEVPNYILCEKENKVYREMMLYFSRVKHQYLTSRHIANAVVNAADGLSYELEQLAWATYRLLLESERKNKIHEYMECHELNRFWKMFLIQTYEVSEKGNVYFAENLEHIRLELMEEIYRRKRRLYAYSGYVFVTVTPFFMLPVLKNWGLESVSLAFSIFSLLWMKVMMCILSRLIRDHQERCRFSQKLQATVLQILQPSVILVFLWLSRGFSISIQKKRNAIM